MIDTHIVTENCIKCKYTDCVDVCPVDCFHEGPNFLAINPDECINCGVCVAECPAHAIVATTNAPDWIDVPTWSALNERLSKQWPVLTKKKDALPDAEEWVGKPNKLDLLEE